jgi:hypothetical protein
MPKPKMKVDLMPTIWKDKKVVYILTYLHQPPKGGNLSGEH